MFFRMVKWAYEVNDLPQMHNYCENYTAKANYYTLKYLKCTDTLNSLVVTHAQQMINISCVIPFHPGKHFMYLFPILANVQNVTPAGLGECRPWTTHIGRAVRMLMETRYFLVERHNLPITVRLLLANVTITLQKTNLWAFRNEQEPFAFLKIISGSIGDLIDRASQRSSDDRLQLHVNVRLYRGTIHSFDCQVGYLSVRWFQLRCY